jgi:8-oxo-dGTP diphosphatase
MKKTYSYNYPMPSVTTDCILIRTKDNKKKVLLIKRKNEPFIGKWALPGGFVEIDEDLEEGARRELLEETNLSNIDLKQFKTYGKPGRDPRGRTISVVYFGYINENIRLKAGDDASDVAWFDISKLPQLAFDHMLILAEFIEYSKNN